MALALFQKGKPVFWPGGLSVTVPAPITLDASLREEHEIRFSKSSYPIEQAQHATDHIIELPTPLTTVAATTRSVLP